MPSLRVSRLAAVAVVSVVPLLLAAPQEEARLRLLFLGDNAGHRPPDRFKQLQPVLKKRGIDLVYTDKLGDLNAATLGKYDGLVIYANHTKITAEQEKALLDFVASGKGLVPIHCASFCFLNSPKYIELVGAQFLRHGEGIFRTTVSDPKHPIMKGYSGFSSWDETYVHAKHHEKGRTVLEHRVAGKVKEPWTWVRTHGKGRVFYTAWGHDARTWGHPGFHNLIERGIRWACGGDPARAGEYFDTPTMTKLSDELPFKYKEAKVPFYPAGQKWGTLGKPKTQMQLPLSPEESMKRISVPEGFELKLFADEKLIGGKPICMNWDERGRLFVAVTVDYPNELKPTGKGRDRIVMLEDTDGDGKADKVTTFADKLSIPTSLAFARGGLIVHQAPDTLFLKDTDGDGVADERTVLFSGWGTRDTHAGPSNLWYGHDNWMYGIVGYSGFRGTVGKEQHRFGQGLYRFKPDGSALELLGSTDNNSWGVGLSEEGLLFASTANGNPSVFAPIANRYYEGVKGWAPSVLPALAPRERMRPITDKVRQVDHHGGFTAAAGHALYTARTYPRPYWNRTAFVTEPTGHLAATFVLTPDGANYRSRNGWNLVASDDEWFAPIMAEVGPDGHVWILDWYNFIVQHNPTPLGFKEGKHKAYETDLRDKKLGRVYRLVYKSAPKRKTPDLGAAKPAELVAALSHGNMRWRLHAQRLLVERGKADVVPGLVKLIEDRKVDELGLNVGAIHALWALEGLGVRQWKDGEATAEGKVVVAALKHPSAGVRRTAALMCRGGAEAIVAAGLLKDADAQVRLAALLGIAEDDGWTRKVGQALAGLLDEDEVLSDRWLSDALTAAAAAQKVYFLEALGARKAALRAKARAIVTTAARDLALGASLVPDDLKADLDPALRAVASGRPDVAEAVLAGLASYKTDIVTGIKLKPPTEQALVKLLPKLSAAGKANLIRFAKAVRMEGMQKYTAEIVKTLMTTAADAKADDADRVAAARQVIDLQPTDAKAVDRLLGLITIQTPPAVTKGVLEAVAASQADGAGEAIIKKITAGWSPAARAAAGRARVGRAAATKALLAAIEKGTLKPGDLDLDQKQALAAHPDKDIREQAKKVLAKAGGLPNADRQKVVERMLALAKKKGDPAKGKEVFKAQCAKCHTHSGEGSNIGPDLTGMATHPKDELVVHIFDPNRSVEGNFRVYTVTTGDGRIVTGMLGAETKTTIEIIDSEAKKTTVQRANIEDFTGSEKSLMPEGFEKELKETEVIDLLEFLVQKGKYIPLPLDKVATIVSTRGMFNRVDDNLERLIFDDWKPKTFNKVPFVLTDPKGDTVKNVVLLYSPQGTYPPKMPKAVSLPVNAAVKAVHLLSGVAGWAHPMGRKGTVSMIVRLHYKDGKTEDHELKNGEHFADYIRKVDVEGSKHAFALRDQQVRYLRVEAKRDEVVTKVELVKGADRTAPVVMAVTVETR